MRDVADADLAALDLPVGVLPSVPEDPFHQRRTVDGCDWIEVAMRTPAGAPLSVVRSGCNQAPMRFVGRVRGADGDRW